MIRRPHHFYVLNTAQPPSSRPFPQLRVRGNQRYPQCTFVSYVERDTISIHSSSSCYSAASHYAHPAGTVSIPRLFEHTLDQKVYFHSEVFRSSSFNLQTNFRSLHIVESTSFRCLYKISQVAKNCKTKMRSLPNFFDFFILLISDN